MKETVSMEIHNLDGRSIEGYTTWGCIWEQGKLSQNSEYILENQAGTVIPMQSRVTAWWPDGSVKWTAHTADAALMGECAKVIGFCQGTKGRMPEAGTCCEISLTEANDGWQVSNGFFTFRVPREGRYLIKDIAVDGKCIAKQADSVLVLEQRSGGEYDRIRETKEYVSALQKVSVVENGPLQTVIKYEGAHILKQPADGWPSSRIPFVVYLKLGAMEKKFRFTYTFLYDGDEERDFLKGLGLRFQVPMRGGADLSSDYTDVTGYYSTHFPGCHTVWFRDASLAVPMEADDPRWRGNEPAVFQIRFDSDSAYEKGVGTLLINVCGNRFGTIRATLNGENIIDTAERVVINGERL